MMVSRFIPYFRTLCVLAIGLFMATDGAIMSKAYASALEEELESNEAHPSFKPTTFLDIEALLPATAAIGVVRRSNISIVDSLGDSHILIIMYRKISESDSGQTWTISVGCEGVNAIHKNDKNGPSPYSIDVEFNEEDGTIKAIDGGMGPVPHIYLEWAAMGSPANNVLTPANATLAFNIGTIGQQGGLRVSGDQFLTLRRMHDGARIFRNPRFKGDVRIIKVANEIIKTQLSIKS